MRQMTEYEFGKGKDKVRAKALEIVQVSSEMPPGPSDGRRYLELVDFPDLEVSADFMTNDPQPGDFVVFEGGEKVPTYVAAADFNGKWKKTDKTKKPKNKKELEDEE